LSLAESKLLSGFRIVVASSLYPYADSPYYCIFVLESVKRVQRAGAMVSVVTERHGSDDKKFDSMSGVPVVRLRRGLLLPFRIAWWLSTVDAKKMDILHAHAITAFGSVFVVLAKMAGKPVVITVHRADVLPAHNVFLNLVRAFALLVADKVVAVSDEARSLVLRCGARADKVVTVYNAVDESVFLPRSKVDCKTKLGISRSSKVILSVGNLIPRKGFDYLIRALPLVLSKVPDALLIIVGYGPQKEALISLVKSMGLEDRVVIAGSIPTSHLCLYYSAADVFALASFHEGHSMVLLEAMASGLPVVATRAGGNIETVVHGKNGYLVSPKDVASLADSITKILGNVSTMKNFRNESLNIYKEKFSEAKQVQKMAEIYSSLVDNKLVKHLEQ